MAAEPTKSPKLDGRTKLGDQVRKIRDSKLDGPELAQRYGVSPRIVMPFFSVPKNAQCQKP